MKKTKVMVDMDDVICHKGFLNLINEYLKTNYQREDFQGYYIQDYIPNKEDFFKWFLDKNMYDYCELLPHVKEVLKELNEYYDIYIGTSYIFKEIVNNSGHILVQKFEYLQRELPFISPYKYIFLSDKSVLNIPIKIDDRIDNLKGASRKLLFSEHHNLGYSEKYLKERGVERVEDWLAVKRKLLKK